MGRNNILLSRRAVVQAAIESEYGVPPSLGANDGVLVSEPEYTIDPSLLERNIVTPDLSPEAIVIGRRLAGMTFSTELRSNGRSQLGDPNLAPIISRLFRACGYALTAYPSPSYHGVFETGTHINTVNWAKGAAGSLSNDQVVAYYLEVTKAGASGSAEIRVTSDTDGEDTAAKAVTSGTAFTFGSKGASLTPTFAGALTVGQRWAVWLMPSGLALDPVSDDFESITLAMNKDGVLHVMPGSFGTFSIEANAGEYASINWTFTGTWVDPVDSPLNVPTYERTLPAQVELARLRMDGVNLVVQSFSFDQGNEINVRPDVNSKEGYIGTRITGRTTEGGINPEAERVADHNFWKRLGEAQRMPFQMRIGKVPGNTVWALSPSVQYTGLTYQDRDGILAYDAGLRFSRYNGNDEMRFFLC